ncbi:PH domain-containing protein [Companilactobacillus keshanensis]|uniref:PH domain-containing protein n=1 Tax=Companilactobacillus keshanensis TaxID=2486003 RepID=A0ABW4BVN6_9LACO|nr:PH domain-containing protein [Companilactobacillus keshanensis]
MDKVEKLPEDIKTIWRINVLIDGFLYLIILLALVILSIFLPEKGQNFIEIVQIVVGVIAIAILAGKLILIPYRWNFWTYYIDERQVELHKGFFFRKQIIIPIARIQNVTLKQGPILRIKSLQKVIVVTAAGKSEIEGIKSDQAEALKELLMKLAQEAKNDI